MKVIISMSIRVIVMKTKEIRVHNIYLGVLDHVSCLNETTRLSVPRRTPQLNNL